MSAEEVLAKIEPAFAAAKYPGDDDLTESAYADEPAARVRAFRAKTHGRSGSDSSARHGGALEQEASD